VDQRLLGGAWRDRTSRPEARRVQAAKETETLIARRVTQRRGTCNVGVHGRPRPRASGPRARDVGYRRRLSI